MTIERLQRRNGIEENKKLNKNYDKMQGLIVTLDKRDLPSNELTSINEHIVLINSFDGTEKELIKILKKTYTNVLDFINEKLELVPKHHFRALWILYASLAAVVLSTVSTAFGSISIGNLASVFILFGILIGILVGSYLDSRAEKEGRQIELEVKGY